MRRGLEHKIKLVVGGALIASTRHFTAKVGADAWAPDGVTAARVIAELIRR